LIYISRLLRALPHAEYLYTARQMVHGKADGVSPPFFFNKIPFSPFCPSQSLA